MDFGYFCWVGHQLTEADEVGGDADDGAEAEFEGLSYGEFDWERYGRYWWE
jgi:hypothetical protein